MSTRLATTLCGVPLASPVLASSGTFGYGVEFARLVDLHAVAGFFTKGLSHEPTDGNPAPRLYETGSGMLNSVGLQNIGVRAFVATKLPALRGLGPRIFANVWGHRVGDYVEALRVLEDADGVAGYELNVSCPNTENGGMIFASDPRLLAQVVSAARAAVKSKRPLIVKLSPNITRIEPIATAAVEAGADALSLINTLIGLAIDPRSKTPRLGNGFGGLSGPAIKPVALRFVYEAAQAVKVPIIGLGGIANGEDAAEFLIAGASAVQVGTAHFWNPGSVPRIARELHHFLTKENIANAADLVGTLKMPR